MRDYLATYYKLVVQAIILLVLQDTKGSILQVTSAPGQEVFLPTLVSALKMRIIVQEVDQVTFTDYSQDEEEDDWDSCLDLTPPAVMSQTITSNA